MVDVVVANLKRVRTGDHKRASTVREKRMRTAEGKLVKVLALDANSATFIDDLTTVFEKNVAKARRENKQLLGSSDGVRAKS
jgi:anti-anti-sigma regulatory factor